MGRVLRGKHGGSGSQSISGTIYSFGYCDSPDESAFTEPLFAGDWSEQRGKIKVKI